MIGGRKKRGSGVVVRREWLSMWPRRGSHRPFWLEVARRVKSKGVRQDDWAAVRECCREVEREIVTASKARGIV